MKLSQQVRDTLDTSVAAAIQYGSDDFSSILRSVFERSSYLCDQVPPHARMHAIDNTLRRLKRRGIVQYDRSSASWKVVGRDS